MNVYLSVVFQKSSSDLDLSMDTDKGGSLSDLADDGESTAYSAAEQSDGASVHESEYINPRGVRFMPHQHVHDGKNWKCQGVPSHIDGLVQERRNSIANALELRLSCTNPSIWGTSSPSDSIIQ